jgi:hypothetical protein
MGVCAWGVRAREANFREADLTVASFSRADLTRAKFDSAYLLGTDFTNAEMSGVGLCQAMLQGARFSGANLQGADLRYTRLTEGKAASSPCLRPGSTLALRGRGFHPALDQGDAHAPLEPQHKVPRPKPTVSPHFDPGYIP